MSVRIVIRHVLQYYNTIYYAKYISCQCSYKYSVSSHCCNPALLEQNLPGQEPELSWGKFDQSLGKKEFTEYLVLLQIKYKILDEI